MEKTIKEINQILSKIAKENGYYIIPIKYMDKLFNNFDSLKSENKRLMRINQRLRDEIKH